MQGVYRCRWVLPACCSTRAPWLGDLSLTSKPEPTWHARICTSRAGRPTLDRIEGAERVLPLLFEEAFGDNCGRHALVDRLFEVVLIQLLRYLMETDQVRGGMLAGLSHPRLRKALVAMHEQPGYEWSLEVLADLAGMSRSVFAGTFRTVVGCTAGAYLQSWRVRLAQQALRKGQSLKMIAIDVGYGSEAALSRAFKAQCGLTPRDWRQIRNPA